MEQTRLLAVIHVRYVPVPPLIILHLWNLYEDVCDPY